MNWQSTKFIHAMIVQAVSSVALFTGHMTDTTFVAATTLALGIYAYADVKQKQIEKTSDPNPR